MTDALTIEDLAFLDAIALDTIEPVEPPAFVRARLLELVARTPQDHGTTIVRANEGTWRRTPLPGIDFKKLSSNHERNTVTLLMRFAPGAVLPAHVNHGKEDAFILSGTCTLGGLPAAAGDFQHIDEGVLHPEIVSMEGCVVLLVVDYADYIAA